ncbi:hypothetical protein [Gaoshiqia sediminis]|uniref:Uncharacterized protein n=1 Tax=Gaoshiqia sediminis TaxID=2986998 RepID=A0AA41Y6G0_9BACT|nr:hypothetical protein [Gaoshiqia sediminis]MCW0482799.1 hypothetical protein [Gaoshiqia sediminis]
MEAKATVDKEIFQHPGERTLAASGIDKAEYQTVPNAPHEPKPANSNRSGPLFV